MRLKAFRGKMQQTPVSFTTLHVIAVPHVAFELALYRMRFTNDSTQEILSDYLRELGA